MGSLAGVPAGVAPLLGPLMRSLPLMVPRGESRRRAMARSQKGPLPPWAQARGDGIAGGVAAGRRAAAVQICVAKAVRVSYRKRDGRVEGSGLACALARGRLRTLAALPQGRARPGMAQ